MNNLQAGYFIRFSQCFYCISYSSRSKKRNLCLLNNIIYEFDYYDGCNNQFNLSENLYGNYYNLLAINNNTNIDYFIYFIDYNKHINLFHYSFIVGENRNKFIKNKIIHNYEIEDPKSLSCQIHSSNKQLLCFYIKKPYLYSEIFDINFNFTTINKTNITFNFRNESKITLKT